MSHKTVVQRFEDCPEDKLPIKFQVFRGQELLALNPHPLSRATTIMICDPRTYTEIDAAMALIRRKARSGGPAVAVRIAYHDPAIGSVQNKWLIGAQVPAWSVAVAQPEPVDTLDTLDTLGAI